MKSVSRRNMLAATAAGGLLTAATAAGAQTGPVPQPQRPGRGGTDHGPRNLVRDRQNPDLLVPPWLVDDTSSQERVHVENEDFDNRRKALGEALTVLNDRELRIFEARRLIDEPIALEDLAEKFGVSRERVRQIEVRAFEKVQMAVQHRVATMERPDALAAR
jgi:hypothetical protein